MARDTHTGTGGSPDAFCEDGDCATDTQKADDCEAFVADCVAQVGEAERDGCIQSAEFGFCAVNGGTGGTGGSGGMAGTGGGGGTGGTPDADLLCNEKLCLMEGIRKQICKLGIAACIAENPFEPWECATEVVEIICKK